METNNYNRYLTVGFKTSTCLWKYVIPSYLEKHRIYHTVEHIENMFDIAVTYGINLNANQLYAILGHDIVYQPGAVDNEERSAERFIDILKIVNKNYIETPEEQKKSDKIFQNITQIILDTKNHIPTIEESKDVIDLDLFELGTDKYFDNGVLIRQEFWKYNDKEFNTGRIKWLESMLARETIFKGFVLKELIHIENKARMNIEKELNNRKGIR